ncbi:MAG TPA: hypothetical protein VHA52_06535, partial [Candidatus Babeliaceae bacterium]|nr:hypothetical protein [Candidatus Babeliaceae bacterium]
MVTFVQYSERDISRSDRYLGSLYACTNSKSLCSSLSQAFRYTLPAHESTLHKCIRCFTWMLPLLRYSSKRFDSSVSLTLKSIKTIHQFTTLVALFQSINQLDSKEFWRIGYEFLKQTDGLLKLIPLSCDIFNETVQLGTNLLNRSYRKVATSIFNIALSSLDGLIRLSPKMEYFICFLTLQLISRIVSLVKRESADIIEVLPRLIAEGIELKDALHSLSVKRSLEGTGEV